MRDIIDIRSAILRLSIDCLNMLVLVRDLPYYTRKSVVLFYIHVQIDSIVSGLGPSILRIRRIQAVCTTYLQHTH